MTKEFELKSHKTSILTVINREKRTSKSNEKQEKILLKTSKNAFSLIELLVVILILGLLAGTVVPKIIGSSDKAKRDLVCISMKGAENALDMFKIDNGIYPETEEGFRALQQNPDSDKYSNYAPKGYLKELPKDSWGKEMLYLKKANGFEIVSYGADQREGGTEEAADIKFSECKKK